VSSHLAPPPTSHYTQPESILHRLSMELDLHSLFGLHVHGRKRCLCQLAGVGVWSLKRRQEAKHGPLPMYSLCGAGPYFVALRTFSALMPNRLKFWETKDRKNSSEVHKYRALEIGKNNISLLCYVVVVQYLIQAWEGERDSIVGRISRQEFQKLWQNSIYLKLWTWEITPRIHCSANQ